MKQKGNIPIPILVVIIVALLSLYVIHTKYSDTLQFIKLYQPVNQVLNKKPLPATNSGETKDWKTYTNDMHAFTVRYPNDWNLDKNSSPEKVTFYGNVARGNNSVVNVSILVTETSKFKQSDVQNYDPFDSKNIQKGNLTFTILTYAVQYGGRPSEETQKLAKETMVKILSTFKFLP